MRYHAIVIVTGVMLLGLAPTLSAQQTIEETCSASFHVDGRGNASHQIIVQYPPSSYADYLKTMSETLKSQTLIALQRDYTLYGWEVKNASCEVSGLGAGENLQITVTCEVPSLARWSENRWTIGIGYANPEEAAGYLINKWNTMRTVLLYLGVGNRYIENVELAFILPEGAEIVNRAELENREAENIEYGGGTYTESSLHIEKREGRSAVIMRTQIVITTENITITPQELAQRESEKLIVEYTGVPLPPENFLLYIAVGVAISAVIVAVALLKRR